MHYLYSSRGFDTMSGFNTTVWQKKPTKRKAKSLWLAINRVSGSPPSMMEYLPPNRWTLLEDGNRVWRNTAEWVIHHELGMFRFKGAVSNVVAQIEEEGLN
tara:strand:+ start:580 stop:882 length:303 start_codon:yes stop_codon:yes gene_type:complete